MCGAAFNFAAKHQLPVFPVITGAKTPAVANWQQWASADTWSLIEGWPSHANNYGVRCGEIVVIDVDAHKGGLASLASLGTLPPTYTVSTPRGGKHFYFRPPAGARFGNSVEKLAPGIDVRGAGGYVVGPGSEVGGRPYVIETDVPIADLPAGLAQRLRAAPKQAADGVRTVGQVEHPGRHCCGTCVARRRSPGH